MCGIDGVYWGLTALDLMGARDALPRDEMIAYVKSCQHSNGLDIFFFYDS